MAKYLIIVESPAKAKTIKKYLGRDYTVVASFGHLRDLPKSQLGIDLENNFMPKYITIRGKGDLMASLKKEAKAADHVYLATDPDREGEAIAWHLASVLGLDPASPCRITFNEITKTALKAAVREPRAIDLSLVDAQQARRVVDRILGYQLSPLLWRKIKKGLSAGRVQSVVTRLVVEREQEIEGFIPDEYWTLSAVLKDPKHKAEFKARFHGKGSKKLTISNQQTAEEIYSILEKSDFTVAAAKYDEKQKSPAPPFTTSTLQQEASRRLGFTSRKTMAAAQILYEGVDVQEYGTVGLITYMRTDSLRVSVEAMEAARLFIAEKYGEKFNPPSPRYYKSRAGAQDAHEAIRPTNVAITPDLAKQSLPNDQYKLYKLIWERFMASQMANAVYETLQTDISAADYIFKASFSKQKFKGFEMLYGDDADDSISGALPSLTKGQILTLKKLEKQQNFTEPPSRYTEGALVRAMEEKGIGRPSTYAPTISTILTRGYVVREKKLFYPTELGYVTTELMKDYFGNIINVEFTADMEAQLDHVEEGTEDWVSLVRAFYVPFSDTLQKADAAIGKMEVRDEESDVICEKCGRTMVYKMGRFGKFLACPGFPECRNAKPITKDIGVPCPKCGNKILERVSKKGRLFYVCENSDNCDVMLWDKPTGQLCNKCESPLVEKRRGKSHFVACSNKDCK
ncbi:MAG: type I DNA topoisomerase [Clostridia bacterium]|nr:type I DNA topoisomerase [Clostridia bacterium]